MKTHEKLKALILKMGISNAKFGRMLNPQAHRMQISAWTRGINGPSQIVWKNQIEKISKKQNLTILKSDWQKKRII